MSLVFQGQDFSGNLPSFVNGAAARLVTFNERHLTVAAREFGIGVLRPRDMWKEVQRRNEKK